MNKWVKRKWLKALRSGEYQKGFRRLGWKNGTYCCLGVLACEMVPEFIKEVDNGNNLSVDNNTSYLPDDLITLYGLDNNAQRRLAEINDGSGTFDPVIAYIEENL